MTAAQRWLLVMLALLAVAIEHAHGAYIQAVPCVSTHFVPRVQHDLADLTGMRARLEHLNATHDRLFLDADAYKNGCDDWPAKFNVSTVALELTTLGRDDAIAYFDVAQHCKDSKWVGQPKRLLVESDYPMLPQLSTFQLALYFLLDGDNDNHSHNVRDIADRDGAVEAAQRHRVGGCVRSAATTRPDTWLMLVLRYVPMGILVLVVAAGVVRSLPSTIATLATAASTPGGLKKTPPRPILPDVGDCLQYLQFVFLTACLSLRYPGFYQPAVSELRWYSLFGASLFKGYYGRPNSYDGFVDGIYELNGTFGGTYGAELMTQVAGAPLTMSTWFNMVICVAIAAGAVAVLLWALWVLEARKTVQLGLPALGGTGPGNGSSWVPKPGPLVNNVAKVILSYFMLPVVALSVYQLDYADQLPLSHSAFAVALLAALVAAFGWLVWRLPTRSLGVLLFNSAKRYRRLDVGDAGPGSGIIGDDDDDDDDNDDDGDDNNNERNGANHSTALRSRIRPDKVFVYALFLTTVLRAALIGGVQVSGLAQVISLFCTEFIFATYIVAMQAYPLFSIGSFATAVRVLSVAAMIAFVPDMITEAPREIIGYAVLGMHALFLVCGFGIGAAWHLGYSVWRRWRMGRDAEIYGLRDLNRRPDSRNVLGFRSDLDIQSPSSPQPQSPSYYRRSQLPDRPFSGEVHSPHPGVRLNIPSLYSGSSSSGRDSTVYPSSYPQSPVSPVGVRTSSQNRRSAIGGGKRSATPSTLNDSRLNSLRTSDPRNSSSGASGSSGSSRGSRSGNGSSDGGYFFRQPRSSMHTPSLTGSSTAAQGHGDRSLRTQSALFSRAEPALLPGEASRPQSAGGLRNANEHDEDEVGGRGKKRRKKTIRIVSADEETRPENDTNDRNTVETPDTLTGPLGPRWNDYTFREADLIFGGPDEGEFETARAHYGVSSPSADEETFGRPSTTTVGSASTSRGGKASCDDTRNEDANEDGDNKSRRSWPVVERKRNDKRPAVKGIAKMKLYQIRQLSSQSRLSMLSSASGSKGPPADGDTAGDAAEQGFSVRRPKPPEHVLRQMAAAATAARAQQQQHRGAQDVRGSSSLDSVREHSRERNNNEEDKPADDDNTDDDKENEDSPKRAEPRD